MRSAQQIGQNGLGQSGPGMPQVPVDQKVPPINDDAKDVDQESESSTTADEESIDEESTDEESTEEKTKESMVISNEVAKPKPAVKSERIYTEEDVKNLKEEIADKVAFTLMILLIAVGCIFFGIGYHSRCSREKSILSEKIIVAKELMKLQGIHDHSKLQQVVDVLNYDFVEHGVIKNIREEELIKAIFKHSYNDPLAMDKLMKLECHHEHTRIYILAKCSKGNTVDDIAVQCKFLYEKCGII